MKIRSKILYILVGVLAVLNLLILLAAQAVIQSSYTRLEESYMELNGQRVRSALEDRLSKMELTLTDWSSWTETYEYAAGRNPDFIVRNLMDETFISLNVNLIAIMPSDGRRPYAKSVDLASGREQALPRGFSYLWGPSSPVRSVLTDGITRKGILVLPDRVLLLAARPVYTSERTGPATGVIVMARLFDDAELQTLSGIVQLPLARFSLGDSAIPEEIKETLFPPARAAPLTVRKAGPALIEGYVPVVDLTGKNGIVLRVQSKRDISGHGRKTIAYFMFAIMLLSGAAGLTVWILLRQVVLRPLDRLNSDAARIRASADMSERIAWTGNDELSAVIHALNGMLDALEENQGQLQKARRNQALGQLAGGTAHEFNNILAIMQGSIEMVMNDPKLAPSDSELLQKAYRAGLRGRDIVAQILDFSKTARETHEILSLPAVVRAALDMDAPLFPAHIALVVELDFPVRQVKANRVQVEQMVLNLCKNSIDAIGGVPGTVTVRVEDAGEGDFVTLSVGDTGGGIPASLAGRIFDPFFTTKQVGKGTGLGLSVVQGFMQQHEGTIDFESKTGEGTTFFLRFPAVAGGAPPERKTRILIVSPDGAAFRLPVLALETEGYQVALEGDLEQALDRFRGGPGEFLLVLVDEAAVPGDVLVFCRALRAVDPDCRLCLLKETLPEPNAHDLSAAGVRDVLFKPLTVRSLLEIL